MADDLSFDHWPVLPEGVEAVTLHRVPEDWDSGPNDCFVCGSTITDAMAFGIPGRGTAHAACWDECQAREGLKKGTGSF